MKDKHLFISSVVFLILYVFFLIAVFSPLNKLFSPFVSALIIVYALYSPVTYMEKLKIKPMIATCIIYGGCVLIIAFAVSFILPKIGDGINEVVNILKEYFGALEYTEINKNMFSGNVKNIYEAINFVVKTCINGFVGIVAAFYVLADPESVKMNVAEIIPEKLKSSFKILADDVKLSLDSFFKGQLLIAAILFVMEGVFLSVAGVPYAWVLGLIGGIFDIVPYAGAFISISLIIFITFLSAPEKIVIVAVGLLIIQQIENNIITPKISSETLSLHPTITVLALYLGSFGGFWGILLAIPLACILKKICERLIQSLL